MDAGQKIWDLEYFQKFEKISIQNFEKFQFLRPASMSYKTKSYKMVSPIIYIDLKNIF